MNTDSDVIAATMLFKIMFFCQSFNYKYYTVWEFSPELYIYFSPSLPFCLNKFLLDPFQMYVDLTVLEFVRKLSLWIFRTRRCEFYFQALFINHLCLFEFSLNGTVSQFMNLIFVTELTACNMR